MGSDPHARFAVLYDENYATVYGYAASRVGVRSAEEIASETFGVAWERFRQAPEQPAAWLLGIARQVIGDSLRTEERQLEAEAAVRAMMESEMDDVATDVADRAAALRGLSRLSDSDRELLTLVAWHGLSTAEAAQVLGCSTTAYFVRLHRARRRLAAQMERENSGREA